MKKKQAKLPTLRLEDKEALLGLIEKPEFKAFERLLKIEQNNIVVVQWFRINSNDPDIVRKKAYYEGRFAEIKTLLGLFDSLRKRKEKKE